MKEFKIGVILKAFDQLSGPFKASTAAIADFQKQAAVSKRNAKAIMDTTTWKATAAGAAASAAAIGLSVKAYGDLATAQGEIASLGIEAEGIQKITRAAKEFSNTWSGTTTPEFISAAYDIKGGINSLGDAAVGEFTKIAAITGKATKSTTQEMTSLFAVGYGIYRQQFEKSASAFIKDWDKLSEEARDIEFAKSFGSGITAAVNVFKSDGQQMAAALQNLGSSATAVGVSFAEQLAVLGQAQATYKGGSEAASAYKTFLSGVATAQKKLGISFQDSEGQMLPMVNIIEKLRKKYGETISVAESKELQEAFGGQEAIKFINTFWNKTGDLTKGIATMGEEVTKGTASIEKMAQAMNKGPNEKATVLAQKFNNLTASLGEGFAPAAIFGIDALSGLVGIMQKAVEKAPGLSAGIVGAASALLGIATIVPLIGVYVPMFKAGIAVVKSMTITTKIAAAATKAWTLVQAAFNAVMSANPVALIVLGVVALAVAAFLVIKNWKKVAPFFAAVWKAVTGIFKRAWDFIWGALDNPVLQGLLLVFAPIIGLPVLIIKNWKAISSFFKRLWADISGFTSSVWRSIKSFINDPIGAIKDAWSSAAVFLSGIWDGVKNAAGAAWDWIGNKVLGIWETIKAPFEAIHNFFSGGESGAGVSGGSPSGAAYHGPSGASYPVGQMVSGSMTKTSIEKNELKVTFDNLPRGTRVNAPEKTKGVDVYAGYASAF